MSYTKFFDDWSLVIWPVCDKFYEMWIVSCLKQGLYWADMAQNMPKIFHNKTRHQIYSNLIISVEEPHIQMHQPQNYVKNKICPCA
jgi:hypothetical protein